MRTEKGSDVVVVERESFPVAVAENWNSSLKMLRARASSLSISSNCGLPAPIRATCTRVALPFQRRRKESAPRRHGREQE